MDTLVQHIEPATDYYLGVGCDVADAFRKSREEVLAALQLCRNDLKQHGAKEIYVAQVEGMVGVEEDKGEATSLPPQPFLTARFLKNLPGIVRRKLREPRALMSLDRQRSPERQVGYVILACVETQKAEDDLFDYIGGEILSRHPLKRVPVYIRRPDHLAW